MQGRIAHGPLKDLIKERFSLDGLPPHLALDLAHMLVVMLLEPGPTPNAPSLSPSLVQVRFEHGAIMDLRLDEPTAAEQDDNDAPTSLGSLLYYCLTGGQELPSPQDLPDHLADASEVSPVAPMFRPLLRLLLLTSEDRPSPSLVAVLRALMELKAALPDHLSAQHLRSHLTCPVCYCTYNQGLRCPMIVGQCGHSACFSCLVNMHANEWYACPTCLKMMVVPASEWRALIFKFGWGERPPAGAWYWNYAVFQFYAKNNDLLRLMEHTRGLPPSKPLIEEIERHLGDALAFAVTSPGSFSLHGHPRSGESRSGDKQHDILHSLFSAGVSPNLLDSSGLPPLFHAVVEGRPEIVKLLVSKGASLSVLAQEPLKTRLQQAVVGKAGLPHANRVWQYKMLSAVLRVSVDAYHGRGPGALSRLPELRTMIALRGKSEAADGTGLSGPASRALGLCSAVVGAVGALVVTRVIYGVLHRALWGQESEAPVEVGQVELIESL